MSSCIQGCYTKLKEVFENNLLNTGIGVIVVCIIEVWTFLKLSTVVKGFFNIKNH